MKKGIITDPKKIDYYLLLPFFLMLCFYLLSRFWGTAITCWDDAFTYSARYRFGSVWNASWAMASSQARFYDLFIYTMAQIPHLFNNLEIYNSFRIISSLMPIIAFCLFIKTTFNLRTALFMTILLMGLLETGYSFNPFHALPLWFGLGLAFILFSMMFYWNYLQHNSKSMLTQSIIFYFLSMLTYEPFLFYGIAFFIMVAWDNALVTQFSFRKLLDTLLKLTPMIICAITYVILYWVFKTGYPSEYEGIKLSFGAKSSMITTVIRLSISGLNWSGPFFLAMPLQYQRILMMPLALSVGIGIITTYILIHLKKNEELSRKIFLFGLIGMLFMFLPNLLYAFSAKYRDQRAFPLYYLATFYSGFAMVPALSALMLSMVSFMERFKLGLYTAVALGCLTGIFSYANLSESDHIYANHRLESGKWVIADRLIKDSTLENKIKMYFPQIINFKSPDPYDYWSYYFSNQTGHQLAVINILPEGPYDPFDDPVLVVRAFYSLSAGNGIIITGILKEKKKNSVLATSVNIRLWNTNRIDLIKESIDWGSNRVGRFSFGTQNLSADVPGVVDINDVRIKISSAKEKRTDLLTDFRSLKYVRDVAMGNRIEDLPGIADRLKLIAFKNMYMKYGDSVSHSLQPDIWIE
jgi:hypothetical protein